MLFWTESFLSLKPVSYWPWCWFWGFSESLIHVCKRKRGSSFRFILISRDKTAECAWRVWSRGSFTLGSWYRITIFQWRVAVEKIFCSFGLLPSLVLFLWTKVGRAVIYSVVGEKKTKAFLYMRLCVEGSWAVHTAFCNTIMPYPGRHKKKGQKGESSLLIIRTF